jgi:hypothetical protein
VVGFIHLLLYYKETAHGTNLIGGWVDPKADLDVVERKRLSYPCLKSNPDSSVILPVA